MLKIDTADLMDWLNNQNTTVGHTHSASHCFLSFYLQEKLGTRAVYVNETFTRVCKLSKWTDYQNPTWITKLIQATNDLHKYTMCNKFHPATLSKKLTKEDVLGCASKLLKQEKKSKVSKRKAVVNLLKGVA
jgi:hypothetical protein